MSLMKNHEDVTMFTLDADRERELLRKQNECIFMWNTRDGYPLGVVMSYVFRDGRFWLTASRQRQRIPAVRRDDRVAICVNSTGTDLGRNKTVSYRGRCEIRDDAETKAWFYPALSAALTPDDPDYQRYFTHMLDSPRRVILCVTPETAIKFDGDKKRFEDSRSFEAWKAGRLDQPAD